MNPPIVTVENLSFGYNGRMVLQDVNLTIRDGDFMAMIGPNGGGKTTFLEWKQLKENQMNSHEVIKKSVADLGVKS